MDNFTVSPVVEQTLAQLKALPCVKTSLDFLKTDSELTLEQQVAMAKIPAPTFHEREKALRSEATPDCRTHCNGCGARMLSERRLCDESPAV